SHTIEIIRWDETRMHGEGLRRCQRQLFDLLVDIPRDELNGGLHFGHDALRFLHALEARLAEPFLLRHGANRVDVVLDILGNELLVATHTTLHVNEVIGVAHGTDALGDGLTLSAEALGLLASSFYILRPLLQARCRLWGTPWRRAVAMGEIRVPLLERLFGLHNGLGRRALFDSQRRCDRFTQLMLPMEEVWRVMR